ncbi:MAG: MFS transporter, partial [Dehalococcoidia bacterium]|nr:MFS transporter [Dehalococcoidia bacterium]
MPLGTLAGVKIYAFPEQELKKHSGKSWKNVNFAGLRTFSSLGNRNYRYYFGTVTLQTTAMYMQTIVRSLLVYRITGSVALLGTVALLSAIPEIVFSLFGGVLADRIPKKLVLIFGQASYAVASLVVALCITIGYISPEHPESWWVLAVTAFFRGGVLGIVMPSRQAIISELVGTDLLMNALSINNLVRNISRLLSPALAGILIDVIGFEAVYYIMTLMYLLAIFLTLPLPLTGAAQSGELTTNPLTGIADGLKYVWKEKVLLSVILLTMFITLLSSPYMQLLAVFTDDILRVGATGLGVLVSVSGIGAMVGTLVLASLPNRRRGLMLLVSGAILGLALVGFSFSSAWPLSLVLSLI